jgi:signal transduction histidine kinase
MDRLFLRVYVNLLLAMLLAGVVVRVLVTPRMDEQLATNVEESLAGPVGILAEVLAEERAQQRDVRAVVDRASARFGAPAVVVSRADLRLDATELARLDQGRVVRSGPPFGCFVHARIPGTDEIVRLGPILVTHPMGGARGASLSVLLGAGLLLGTYLLLRPIRRRLAGLGLAARALGRGELGARAEIGSSDAIGDLAAAFNAMANEIQRLIAAREELLRMTSHELRTPIQRMHFTVERVRDARDAEERGRALDRFERELTELDQCIEELLTYVRLRDGRPRPLTPTDLGPMLAELCESLAGVHPGVALAAPGAEGAPISLAVEPRLSRRAVSNLIVNALRHARSRVEVTVEPDAEAVRIHVDDDGPGIPAADRERIFEPFIRLHDERTQGSRGFGLGLAIVRQIAEVHGGSVTALTSQLGGARLRLSLPRGP